MVICQFCNAMFREDASMCPFCGSTAHCLNEYEQRIELDSENVMIFDDEHHFEIERWNNDEQEHAEFEDFGFSSFGFGNIIDSIFGGPGLFSGFSEAQSPKRNREREVFYDFFASEEDENNSEDEE